MKKNKQVKWAVITLLIGILTIVAVLSQSKDLTFGDLMKLMRSLAPQYQILIYLCIAGYIVSEGIALYFLLKEAGYPQNLLNTTIYGASDIYCAAITPSATGGQPVCAWFMKRDNIPMGYITAVLSIYLIMHTFSTLTIGIICAFAGRSVFAGMSILSKILVVIGYLMITALAVLFVLVTTWEDRIKRVGNRIINHFEKKGKIKRGDYYRKKLDNIVDDYGTGVKSLGASVKVLFLVYIFNIIQRLCQTVISTIVYSATGGAFSSLGTVFVTQIFSVMGSSATPVPGGMGIADYILYDGLHTIMDKEASLQLELMSRGFSFYLCIIICLAIVVIGYIVKRTAYAIYKL